MSAPSYWKSIFINFICSSAAAGCLTFFQGGSYLSAFVFTGLILWLCNEAWYAVMCIPAILTGLWGAIKKSDVQLKTQRIIYRWSAVLLLVIPHFIFLILFILDWVTLGVVSSMLELPLTHSAFACAFLAPLALWIIGKTTMVLPLSFRILFARLFEPELFMDEQAISGVPQATEEPVVIAPIEGVSPIHPDLQAVASELIYYGRAELNVMNGYVKRQLSFGVLLIPVVLCLYYMAAQIYESSGLGTLLLVVLGIVFTFVACSLLRAPGRWKEKLSKAEYAFTEDRVFIVEGDSVVTLKLNATLNIHHESITAEVGNIYLSKTDVISAGIKKVFGDVQVVDLINTASGEAPLQGFFQIKDSHKVFRMLEQCRKENGGKLNAILRVAEALTR